MVVSKVKNKGSNLGIIEIPNQKRDYRPLGSKATALLMESRS